MRTHPAIEFHFTGHSKKRANLVRIALLIDVIIIATVIILLAYRH